MLKPCKISIQNTWGFELHKNDKSWRFETLHCSLYSDLYICHFCVAQIPNYFALKICTVVVYIIENVHDCFQIFLKLLNMFFEFFIIVGSLEFGSTKSPLKSFGFRSKNKLKVRASWLIFFPRKYNRSIPSVP